MKYILTPKNKDQDFPCRLTVTGTKDEVLKVASKLAGDLTAALLLQCEITVHIQTVSEGFRGAEGILACGDGKFLDGKTGELLPLEAGQ